MKIFWKLVAMQILLLLTSCVGPTTPFGALDGLGVPKKDQAEIMNSASETQPQSHGTDIQPRPTISFTPGRQVLHKPVSLKVTINDPDPIPESARLRVYYNGYNVSNKFLKQAHSYRNSRNNQWTFEFKRLPLLASRDSHVRFIYNREQTSEAFFGDLLPPKCLLFEDKNIVTTGRFSPPPSYLQSVEEWSNHHRMNPALLAGLIAQESSFDAKAVSWAKAVGLTQVTELADVEIAKKHSHWPRSEQIKRYPASVVKTLIAANQISQEDDWRLNPELSVRGGLTYLEYLNDYWTRPQNYAYLDEHFSSPNETLTDVVLASYNSGAARVKKAISENGKNYLDSNKLREARKYVNRINSYCYVFSANRGDSDE